LEWISFSYRVFLVLSLGLYVKKLMADERDSLRVAAYMQNKGLCIRR
jgi:hypothetical protein